jgi:CRISPR-associated protein Cas5d
MSVFLKVWGDYACFTRPELKVERVSYDVPTPSAARGILEAIYWKPEFKWAVRRIHVINPISFISLARNEVESGSSRSLKPYLVGEKSRVCRSSQILRSVEYVIEAGIVGTDDYNKHHAIFSRRASQGQCFQRPCFGCREFVAEFDLVESAPKSQLTGTKDLGIMLYDFTYENNPTPVPKFYHAVMVDGIITVPNL